MWIGSERTDHELALHVMVKRVSHSVWSFLGTCYSCKRVQMQNNSSVCLFVLFLLKKKEVKVDETDAIVSSSHGKWKTKAHSIETCILLSEKLSSLGSWTMQSVSMSWCERCKPCLVCCWWAQSRGKLVKSSIRQFSNCDVRAFNRMYGYKLPLSKEAWGCDEGKLIQLRRWAPSACLTVTSEPSLSEASISARLRCPEMQLYPFENPYMFSSIRLIAFLTRIHNALQFICSN